MKHLTLESKEFKRVMQNLHLEKTHLTLDQQKRILEIVNAKVEITPTFIKNLMKDEEYNQ